MAKFSIARALAILSALPVLLANDPGYIYGVALNGTSNDQQFFQADLQTFIVSPFPILGPSIDVLGSAATMSGDGYFWCSLYYYAEPRTFATRDHIRSIKKHNISELNDNIQTGDSIVLAGIDLTNGMVAFSYDTSQWTGEFLFILGIFANDTFPHLIRVVGKEPKTGTQVVVDVNTQTGNFTVLGTFLFAPGGDIAYDPNRNILYELATNGNDDDSGNITIFNLNIQPPNVIGTIFLQNFFELPAWDPLSDSLMGLTLGTDGNGNYERNFTLLYPQDNSFNVSVRGNLGEFYALFDGPKAFDLEYRRAFYIIATSPMGEMDAVTIAIDSNPVQILETPGICGFIGYCPSAIAYSSLNSTMVHRARK